MDKRRINRAVVLTAGDGDRMGELTRDRPKVLLPIAEAVAWLGLLIQATYLMTTGTAEVDTNTHDQCRLL